MWSDTESDKDYLNYGEVSQIVIDTLKSKDMLPVSIGVFGDWGAGKSSLLKLIEQGLLAVDDDWIIINFDAWLYHGYDDIRASLLEVIATALDKEAAGNEGIAAKTKDLLSRVDCIRALGILAEGAALASGISTGGLISRTVGALKGASDGIQDETELKELGDTVNAAKTEAGGLISAKAKKTPPKQIDAFREEYGEILTELGKPLVVVIDNLDRCLPANAIQTLEAIRLFLFLPNTAFIVAADEGMIRTSVAQHFKGASERHQIDYLDKLIQLPVHVPKAGVLEIRSYLFMLYAIEHQVSEDKLEELRAGLESALQKSWRDAPITRQDALVLTGEAEDSPLGSAFERADRIAPLLARSPIIKGNPRIVKRLLNVVKMRSLIAHRRSMPLDEAIITKLVIFERCAGAQATADLYALVDAEQGRPTLLKQLEEGEGELPGESPESWTDNPTTKSFISKWAQLEPRLGGVDLKAAIYLSRETMPLGANLVSISQKSRQLLAALVEMKNTSSHAASDFLGDLPLEDHVPVMEGVVNHLKQTQDWKRQPKGFAGACILARHSEDAAKTLIRFIQELDSAGKRPPWLAMLLKKEQWHKDK